MNSTKNRLIYKYDNNYTMNGEQFIRACKNGDILLAHQIKSTFELNIDWQSLLTAVCENNDLNMAKWLYSVHKFDSSHLNIIFERACEKGFLDIAKWIYSLDENIAKCCNASFKLACSNGHIDVVKWFHSVNHNLDYDSAYQSAWERSCENIIDWFNSTMNIKNANIKNMNIKNQPTEKIEDPSIFCASKLTCRNAIEILSTIDIPTASTFPKLTTVDILSSLKSVASLPCGYKLKITNGKILEVDDSYTLTRMYRRDSRDKIAKLLDHTFFELVVSLKNVFTYILSNVDVFAHKVTIENYSSGVSAFLNNYDVFSNVYKDDDEMYVKLCDTKDNFAIVHKLLSF